MKKRKLKTIQQVIFQASPLVIALVAMLIGFKSAIDFCNKWNVIGWQKIGFILFGGISGSIMGSCFWGLLLVVIVWSCEIIEIIIRTIQTNKESEESEDGSIKK